MGYLSALICPISSPSLDQHSWNRAGINAIAEVNERHKSLAMATDLLKSLAYSNESIIAADVATLTAKWGENAGMTAVKNWSNIKTLGVHHHHGDNPAALATTAVYPVSAASALQVPSLLSPTQHMSMNKPTSKVVSKSATDLKSIGNGELRRSPCHS